MRRLGCILEQGDKESSKPLQHADFQIRDGDQLIQELNKEHMVVFAELSPIQTKVPANVQQEVLWYQESTWRRDQFKIMLFTYRTNHKWLIA